MTVWQPRKWPKAKKSRYPKQGRLCPCFGCHVPLPYAGVGRPPKWCYSCWLETHRAEGRRSRELYRTMGFTEKQKNTR